MNYDTQNRFQKAVAQRQSRKSFAPNQPWVTITGLVKVDGQMIGFGPAMITFSPNTKLYAVVLPALQVEKRGTKESRRLIRFSGKTIAVVKNRLIERFGEDAIIFSDSNPDAGTDSISVAKQEIANERDQQVHERDLIAAQATALVNHRQACLDNPEMVPKVWHENVLKMMGPYSGVGADFESERRGFFLWPLGEDSKPTNENWKTFTRICHEQIGVPSGCAPNVPEMCAAYRYGQEHGFFHQVPNYKRSQGYLRDAVLPFRTETAVVTASQAYASAVAKVNKLRLPAGYVLTKSRALAAGLTEFEFEQLIKPLDDAKATSFKDLKRSVEQSRPPLRPSQRGGY